MCLYTWMCVYVRMYMQHVCVYVCVYVCAYLYTDVLHDLCFTILCTSTGGNIHPTEDITGWDRPVIHLSDLWTFLPCRHSTGMCLHALATHLSHYTTMYSTNTEPHDVVTRLSYNKAHTLVLIDAHADSHVQTDTYTRVQAIKFSWMNSWMASNYVKE